MSLVFVPFHTAGGGGPPTGAAGGQLSGTYPNPSVAGLTETTGPTALTIGNIGAGQVLVRSGANIVGQVGAAPSGAAGGQLSGTYPNPAVAGITTTSGPTALTIGAITAGQVLVRSGANVIGQTGAAPTGAAGGDLSGTYPNPAVAAITTTTGPTSMVVGAVAANQWIQNIGGNTLVGSSQLYTPLQTIAVAVTTFNTDCDLGNVFALTAGVGAAWTMANPTNVETGGTYMWVITQNAAGNGVFTFGGNFKWPGGTAPTITQSAGAVDVITVVAHGTDLLGVHQASFS